MRTTRRNDADKKNEALCHVIKKKIESKLASFRSFDSLHYIEDFDG